MQDPYRDQELMDSLDIQPEQLEHSSYAEELEQKVIDYGRVQEFKDGIGSY